MNLLLRLPSMWLFPLLWFIAGKKCTANIIYRSSCFPDSDRILGEYNSAENFIEANGYLAETHSVSTDDGYVLVLHRIPGKRLKYACNELNGPDVLTRSKVNEPHRPAVLIQHGLLGSSDQWFLAGKNSFPFLLVRNGYDVWLGNTRGNRYSKKHVKLSSRSSDYWNFSFHEQGFYDLAAMTDCMLNATGHEKIFFIGHSRGATMSYILLAQRPEYNDKFHLVVSLSPVAYLKHARSSLIKLIFRGISLQDTRFLGRNYGSISAPEINPDRALNKFCSWRSINHAFCMNFISSIAGHNREILPSDLIPIIISHFPDSASLKELLHYVQVSKADKFRSYDYGKFCNMKIYGRKEPPEYNLENITSPMVTFYSQNDLIVSKKDLDRLHLRLKSVFLKHEIPFEAFNHVDFIWSYRAIPFVYYPTINLMNRFWQMKNKTIIN